MPLLILARQKSGLIFLLLLALGSKFLLVAAASPQEVGVTYRALATVHLPGLLVEFLLGVLAYYFVQNTSAGKRRWFLASGALSWVCAWVLFAQFLTGPTHVPGTPGFWVGGMIGTLSALAYMLILTGLAGRFCASMRFQKWCNLGGQISYGTYLFHNAVPVLLMPVMHHLGLSSTGWTSIAIYTGCTLLSAWVLHHLVEAPARRWGRQLSEKFLSQVTSH